jgi:[CysO sulfur-carrier protein]-S-L-cysteine hydrolase
MVTVPRAIRDEMVAHAFEGRPNEICGLLAGRGSEVTRLFRARNKEQERARVRYEIDPIDLLQIFREIDEAGLEHVGIYHSHTHTQAYPSATDIRLAFYPDALYFLVSLMDERDPTVRAFWIKDGDVTEEPVEIIG